MNRPEALRRLETETFDLCIIGGGASGAGCALDAALRGLKVALVEKNDFGAGTSSKSTKLIHGGVRYLEQAFKKLDFGQLRQVRHGLQERHILLANAPHLAHPLALVTPVFSIWEALYFRIGLWLYDRFASRHDTLPPSSLLSRAAARRLLPGLTTRIRGAVRYYDGQMDDARYALALVQSAVDAGAVAANHLSVTAFEKNAGGQLLAACLNDELHTAPPFVLRARRFLNCSGPWADDIRRLANTALPSRLSPSKGVHLTLQQNMLGSADTALLIPKTPDGRVVFAIPFQGELLLGTTEQSVSNVNAEPLLEGSDVDFLLQTLQPYLAHHLDKKQVKAGFGGLRPLLTAGQKTKGQGPAATKGLVRDHEVEHDPVSGLFSLLGGKWTTYRLMARDAVDAVCRPLGVVAPCTTQNHLLAGAEGYTPGLAPALQAEFELPEKTARHLAANYGGRAWEVAALFAENTDWKRPLVEAYPFLQAEVVYAGRVEMAGTIRDVLARRLRLEILDWQAASAAAGTVAGILAKELGWDETFKNRETAAYQIWIEQMRSAANR